MSSPAHAPGSVEASQALMFRYTHGMCDVLALALRRRHGLNLGLVSILKPDDEDGEIYETPIHAFAYLHKHTGWVVDAWGVRLLEEMLMDLEIDPVADRDRFVCRAATEADVREAFAIDEIPEEQILRAIADLDQLNLVQLDEERQAAIPPTRAVLMALEFSL